MRRGFAIPVVVMLVTAPTFACSHSGGGEVRPAEIPVSVEVKNQHALPMEVYAYGSGITQRLGIVHPGMSSHFSMPQNLVGNGSVRFEARPSGNGQPFRSGEILLEPGAVVDFIIAAQLFNSTVTRRP
jgi:hypothetical protein